MSRRRVPIVVVALVGSFLGAVRADAAVARVTCGQVITQSTTLANDLHNCHTDGLVIGADNVTLDLNGHTIDGDGTSENVGIAAFANDNVTIRNGVVQQFVEGVGFGHASNDSLSDVTLTSHRHVGVFADTVRGLTVQRVTASLIDFPGIFATRSSGVRITGNTVRRSGGGIALGDTTGSSVTGNQLSRIGCIGIQVFGASAYNVVDGNTATAGGCEALVLDDGASHNVVTRNTFTGNDGGVGLVRADANLITGNVMRDNHFSGLYLFGSSDNRVDSNVLTGNGEGSEGGMHVLPDDTGTKSRNNTLSRNTTTANIGDGILVDSGSPGTVLDRNVANGNTDDGIDVDEPQTTLRANQANDNGDLGIEAVAGVIDGGGNTASGNGDHRQCTHVSC